MTKLLKLKMAELSPWFNAALVALSASWAGNATMETMNVWFSGTIGVISWPRCFYVSAFMISVALLYRQRQTFFRPRTRYIRADIPKRRKHLILFLSNLDTKRLDFNDNNGVPEELTLTGKLDDDIEEMVRLKTRKGKPVRWIWEMPLRAIRHHLGKLEGVTIICSRESIEQVNWFLNICNRYETLKKVKFYVLKNKGCRRPALLDGSSETFSPDCGWDFESFDELSEAVWSLIRILKKRGLKENEIMIDFTGGQKVTSVVAAATTFNRKIKAQYVSTNPEWEVRGYDVIMAASSTKELGL